MPESESNSDSREKAVISDELLAELDAIRCRLFDLANSQAGNDKGNVACLLHAASSEVSRAQKCLERGNPADEPIPPHLLAQTMPNDRPTPETETAPKQETGGGCQQEPCSQCCGAEVVVFRASLYEWEIAGSAVYDDEEKERLEAAGIAFPDREPPSCYCHACSACGKISEGWVEPDPVFNPANTKTCHGPEAKP